MATDELILKLGVEGGAASIYRTPLPTGGYQFRTEGTSMALDATDSEEWRDWADEPVATIQEALRLIFGDGSGLYSYPMVVHHEYQSVVWEHVQAALHTRQHDSPEMRERSRQRWRTICSAN